MSQEPQPPTIGKTATDHGQPAESITMVPVPNCDGAARFIPSDRAVLKIDSIWLQQRGACHAGREWFDETYPSGCTYSDLRAKLVEENRKDWESWILMAAGGDTATAGYRGTATAGDSGTATAGDSGVISILEWDEKHCRYRVVIGYIGEDGLKPNQPYRVKNGKFEEVTA